jgi:hypothetical protein|tara:strand:- start:160 stop:390 length:231 start_codon:yes stop_codon:yes gene_type:complete
MTNIDKLIDAISSSKAGESKDIFTDIINDKLSTAIDAKRIDIATNFYGTNEEGIEDENIQDFEDESTGTEAELQDS